MKAFIWFILIIAAIFILTPLIIAAGGLVAMMGMIVAFHL